MSSWVNRTVLSGSSTAANGTSSHTCTFAPAAPGNLLVAIMGGAVTFSTPSGWTLTTSAVNNAGLYVFTKTASAGESSFSTTHNGSDYEIKGVIYEYYAGSVVVGTTGSATNLSGNTTATGPSCTSLSGTYTRFAARTQCASSPTNVTSSTWTTPTTTDYDSLVVKSSQDGIWLGIAYDEGATGSSFTPSGYVTTNSGTTIEGVSFALSIVAQPPVVELINYSESNGSGNVISLTTSTLVAPANSVILVFVHGTASGTYWTGDTITVSDSVDGTTGWTGLDSLAISTSPDSQAGRVFYKSFTSSTSRTITIARGTGTAWWGYSVVAITGHNTASPITQAKGAASPYWNDFGNNHSQSVTLSASPVSGNAVIAFLGCNNDANGAATVPSGYTALDLPTGQFENASVAYTTNTTAATINWSDCGQGIEGAIAFAVEVNFNSASTIPIFWVKV